MIRINLIREQGPVATGQGEKRVSFSLRKLLPFMLFMVFSIGLIGTGYWAFKRFATIKTQLKIFTKKENGNKTKRTTK